MDERAGAAAHLRSGLSKAGWRILPLLALGYGASYIDRVNIGFAAPQMNADLGFNAAVYGLGGGLFFLSYALMEVPSNLLLERFGARRWLSRIMISWGLLAAAMMFVRGAGQFFAMRLLLGVAEAGFFPAVIIYLSRWFPPARRSRAVAAFYISFPLSSVVMGSLAGLLLGLDGRLGLSGWQWLFLLEGLPAAVLGLVVLRVLPERPQAASWLSPDEQAAIAAAVDPGAASREPHDLSAIWAALSDHRVLWLGLVNALFLGTGYAFNLSAPQVLSVKTGLTIAQAAGLIAIGGVIGALAMVANAWASDRRQARFQHVIAPLLLLASGYGLMGLATDARAVMAGYFMTTAGASAVNAVLFVLVSELLPARRMVVGVAAANMLGQLGSFVMPTAWGLIRQSSGHVDAGLAALAIPFLLAAGIVAGLAARRSAQASALAGVPT